jgi:glutamate dehydrogenase (NAD(P)+)
VPAPDVNTNEQTMAWIMDTYSMHMGQTVTGVVTGKPVNIGGSRGRREATGRGVSIVTLQSLKHLNMKPEDATVIVQGFGNVGSNSALLLWELGCKVIGIGEFDGGLFNADGIDISELMEWKARKGTIHGFPGATASGQGRAADAQVRCADSGSDGECHHQQERRAASRRAS